MSKFDARRSYAREKFGSAVDIMATSPASIQDRLNDAFMSFSPVQAADFQDVEEQQLFKDIYSGLTSKPALGDEGTVRATLNLMNDDEASRIASLIVSLNFRLSSDDM